MLARSLSLRTSPLARAFCAVASSRPSGTLYIAGTGESNKLGVGDTKDREVPTLVEALKVGAANAATTEIHLHVSFVSSKQS